MKTMITGTVHPLIRAMSKTEPALYPGPTLLRPRTQADADAQKPPPPTLLRQKG